MKSAKFVKGNFFAASGILFRGFRDSCQDLYGFVHIVPDRVRERIIDIASIQFEDGSTYHQYQPLTKRGNNDIGGGFSDDPLWLVGAVCAYVKETGDFSILDVPTPFNNVPGTEVPLMEHLRRCVFDSPIPSEEERVYFHRMKKDFSARLENRALGVGMTISWSGDTLPILGQWRDMGSGEYVLGLEPTNCYIMGRSKERENGTLSVLRAFASVTNTVSISFAEEKGGK